jgi:endonuclease/exonuclease/phosphatase family metal-dependent hydrolase
VRVVTQNLWGVRGDWEARRKILQQGLAQLRPDVVSFQEAIRRDGCDTARDLLNHDYDIVYQRSAEPDGQTAAIASRWPIGKVEEIEQHVTARVDSATVTLVAEIHAPSPFGDMLVVNHVPSWQLAYAYERELQARAGGEFVEELVAERQVHVIVAGDLTDPPDSSSVRFWTGRQSLGGYSVSYRDAWESAHPDEPGDTYTNENPNLVDHDWPFRRLDYILVRCGLHGGPTLLIERCERVFDQPVGGVWGSDHYGVMADFGVPPVRR